MPGQLGLGGAHQGSACVRLCEGEGGGRCQVPDLRDLLAGWQLLHWVRGALSMLGGIANNGLQAFEEATHDH